MIKNIVFDIGKVLLEFEPLKYLNEKFDDSLIAERLHSGIFCSSEWIDLDKGVLTDEEAIEIFSDRHSDLKQYIAEIMKDWSNILVPIDGTVDILKTLKSKGYKIYLLSNFHSTAFQKIYEKYSFFKLSDGMIVSSKVNLLKPDREIYELLINSFSLKPEESLFIDDTLVNVKSAESLGFNVVCFQNSDKLNKELKTLSIL